MISNFRDLCFEISRVICKNPVCIETGSTYDIRPENLMNTSTNNLYRTMILINKGELHSFDIDPEHQNTAKILCENNDSVVFRLGDSVEKLKEFVSTVKYAMQSANEDQKFIDLVLFDSKDGDTMHMLHEYEILEPYLKDKHFILIDDIHNPNSNKWVRLVPILKASGKYTYGEINTPTGLFVAWKGYDFSLG